jgi:hypothetical protein
LKLQKTSQKFKAKILAQTKKAGFRQPFYACDDLTHYKFEFSADNRFLKEIQRRFLC